MLVVLCKGEPRAIVPVAQPVVCADQEAKLREKIVASAIQHQVQLHALGRQMWVVRQ